MTWIDHKMILTKVSESNITAIQFMQTNIFVIILAGGLHRLSPPPHYVYVLRKDEGLCDLYEDHL